MLLLPLNFLKEIRTQSIPVLWNKPYIKPNSPAVVTPPYLFNIGYSESIGDGQRDEDSGLPCGPLWTFPTTT